MMQKSEYKDKISPEDISFIIYLVGLLNLFQKGQDVL